MKRLFVFLAAVLLAATAARATTVGEDGLHKPPWFSVTFKDLRDDLETAKSEGKRLVLIIEQRGCIYCKKVHETVFSDPKISGYIKENFVVVQYNMFGDEEVIDFDGKELTEKTAVRRWGLLFTPTLVFLPESVPDGKTAKQAAVMIVPGAFGPKTSLHAFQWVREKGYEKDEPFQKYHARKLAAGAAK